MGADGMRRCADIECVRQVRIGRVGSMHYGAASTLPRRVVQRGPHHDPAVPGSVDLLRCLSWCLIQLPGSQTISTAEKFPRSATLREFPTPCTCRRKACAVRFAGGSRLNG